MCFSRRDSEIENEFSRFQEVRILAIVAFINVIINSSVCRPCFVVRVKVNEMGYHTARLLEVTCHLSSC